MKKVIFENSTCLDIQQIRKYLTESTNDEERYHIENHLLDCPLCSDAVEGYANHYNFEEDKELEDLEKRFGRKEKQEEAIVRTMPKRSRLSILNRVAAAVLMFIIPVAGFMYWNANADERLFNDYYDGFEWDGNITRGGEDNAVVDARYSKALDFYKAKDYPNSITYLQEYLSTNKEDATATFFLGMAYLEEQKYRQAIDYLIIARINSEQYYEEASWNLALAHIKNMDKAAARIVLDDLLKIENGFYSKKAAELKLKIAD